MYICVFVIRRGEPDERARLRDRREREWRNWRLKKKTVARKSKMHRGTLCGQTSKTDTPSSRRLFLLAVAVIRAGPIILLVRLN